MRESLFIHLLIRNFTAINKKGMPHAKANCLVTLLNIFAGEVIKVGYSTGKSTYKIWNTTGTLDILYTNSLLMENKLSDCDLSH